MKNIKNIRFMKNREEIRRKKRRKLVKK